GFVYLDPPYYARGGSLYKYAFTDADHRRLAVALHAARYRWALSYDDHPRVRQLYAWAEVTGFEMTPTVGTRRGPRRKKREIIIRNGRKPEPQPDPPAPEAQGDDIA